MKPAEFKRRRQQLMKMMGKGTIAILPSASELIRNRDAHYPFRQDSDFLYLTGFNEPDAVLVLVPGRKHGEYILFCRSSLIISGTATASDTISAPTYICQWLVTGISNSDIVEHAYVPWGGRSGIHFFGVTPMDKPELYVPAQFNSNRVVPCGLGSKNVELFS